MKTTEVILALALLAASSCNDLGTPPPVQQSLDDIREAVFRYQFSNNESGQQQSALVYFLGFRVPGDSLRREYYIDPSDDLMARFRGNVPPVKKCSQCSRSIYGVFDTLTGASGLLFRIDSIKEIDNNEVEVAGGYFESGLSASGNIYTVRRVGNTWIVVKDIMLWIS